MITIAFAICIFMFVMTDYWGHLNYHEQNQLFEQTTDYFIHYLCRPEGIAEWLAQFAVQFFNDINLGAFIIASLFLILQLLTAAIFRSAGQSNSAYYPLTLLPSIAVGNFLLCLPARFTFLMAMIILAVALALYFSIKSLRSLPATIITSIIIYWMVGAIGLIFPIFISIHKLVIVRCYSKKSIIEVAVLGVLSMLIPLVLQFFVKQSLGSLYKGIAYIMEQEWLINEELWAVAVFSITILVVLSLENKQLSPKTNILAELAIVLIPIASLLYTKAVKVDYEAERVMRFDYLVRTEQWDEILTLAENEGINNIIAARCVNLALGKKQILPENILAYGASHPYMLLQEPELDNFQPLSVAEVYFHLGLINTAQRLYDEAESFYKIDVRSIRCYKRLAETFIIKGCYSIALKYLEVLKHSRYSDWANEQMSLLGNEKAVNAHPIYGKARKLAPKTDYLLVNKHTDELLRLLAEDHPDNYLAKHYYLCWLILNKSVYQLPEALKAMYQHDETMPRLYQEAYAFVWNAVEKKPAEGFTLKIDKDVVEDMLDFAQMYSRHITPSQYNNTYWYYQFFVTPPQIQSVSDNGNRT